MPNLGVYLLDGFENDLVVVRAEGREVARKAAVTSQLLLGYADSVDVPVERGQVSVEVQLPDRGLAAEQTLTVEDEVSLLASVEGGRLTLQVTEQRPGFM
jgi:hypothetical protein